MYSCSDRLAARIADVWYWEDGNALETADCIKERWLFTLFNMQCRYYIHPATTVVIERLCLTCCHWSLMRGLYRRKYFRGKISTSGQVEGLFQVTSKRRTLLGMGVATTLSGGSGFTTGREMGLGSHHHNIIYTVVRNVHTLAKYISTLFFFFYNYWHLILVKIPCFRSIRITIIF